MEKLNETIQLLGVTTRIILHLFFEVKNKKYIEFEKELKNTFLP